MNRWPVERRWVVVGGEHSVETLTTRELSKYPACCMLGAAGLGKTYELHYLRSAECAEPSYGHYERLALLATSPEGLESRLGRIASRLTERSAVYLDALDEAMIPTRTTALVLTTWIGERLSGRRPRLRVSSRSAVWPADVTSALREVYGRDSVAIATLQPLSTDDVREVAALHVPDPDEFLRAVSRAGALALALQPLTFEMLLGMYVANGTIPTGRRRLFESGVDHLSRERRERREIGTATTFTSAEIVDAAERLACMAMFSGRDVIDLGDAPSAATLGWTELSGLPTTAGGRPLDETTLRTVGASGLCDGDGPGRYRFIHRQFAEYLAGRRVARLLPHQAQSLLASPLGRAAGVAGPLRETAAVAAIYNDHLADWVAETDPEVIGLSEVADDALRRRALLGLLERFRRRELTDMQVSHDEIALAGFKYAGAEHDLAPLLRERGEAADDLLECAVKVVESWQLTALDDGLADVFLDPSAPHHVRMSAGYALLEIGRPEARYRTKSALTAAANDPDLDLRGLALRCNWPGNLSTPELLSALVPRANESHYGAYDSFLSELDRQGFDAAGYRAAGLTWARRFVRRWQGFDAGFRIAQRIARVAVQELDNPATAAALADLLLTACQAHDDSPLDEVRQTSPDREEEIVLSPPLLGNARARRLLLEALAARPLGEHDVWLVARQTPHLLLSDDFAWLLDRATDPALAHDQRTRYAEMANTIHWIDLGECVDAWLAVRNVEPVKSQMNYPLQVDLVPSRRASGVRRRGRQRHSHGNRGSTRRRRSACGSS